MYPSVPPPPFGEVRHAHHGISTATYTQDVFAAPMALANAKARTESVHTERMREHLDVAAANPRACGPALDMAFDCALARTEAPPHGFEIAADDEGHPRPAGGPGTCIYRAQAAWARSTGV